MSEKKKTEAQKPVKVFRNSAIAASVWKQVSADGFEYQDFTISRSWKSKSGKEGYRSAYFARNRADLHATIDAVCDYLEEQENRPAQVANAA